MQNNSLTGRQQQQLGLLGLTGRSQPDVVAALLNTQGSSFNLGGGGLGNGALGGPNSLNLSLGSLPSSSLPQASHQGAMQQSSQLGLPDQLALLSGFPLSFPGQQYTGRDGDLQQLRNGKATRSSDSRSSSAYASRHQAAEQRRRTRINERLELLRKLVPHAERANTACFLEEVIKYIEALKSRTVELEVMLESATGKPVAKSLGLAGMPAGLTLGSALERANDNQAPSPRHPASGGQGMGSGQQTGSQQGGQPSSAGQPASPSVTPPPTLTAQQAAQQLQHVQQQLSQQQQQQSHMHHPQPSQAASQGLPTQLQLPQPSNQSGQQMLSAAQQNLLFPQSGGLSLGGGSLSLGGNISDIRGLSLAQFTAGLQAQQHGLQQAQQALSSHHHHVAQQLSDLQTMQVMQSLHQHQQQQQQATRPAASFHPSNNKAFLHFNEDAYFGGVKPELMSTRSMMGAAASTTPSTCLQLTTVQLPADSNTLLQVETRKTLSGSPVSSEESGVPLKKRKVLVL